MVAHPADDAARPVSAADAPPLARELAERLAPDLAAAPDTGEASAQATSRDDHEDAGDAGDTGDTGDSARAQAVPVARPRGGLATQPIPIVDPALLQRAAGRSPAREDRHAGARTPAAVDITAVPPRFMHAARRGSPRLVVRVAIGHGAAGLALAVGASALFVAEQPFGMETLGLAALVAGGGGAAYALLTRWRLVRSGALVLVATQLGALAWGFIIIGPRVALVLLLPPAIWLALRMGGRGTALLGGAGGLAIYFGCLMIAGGAYVAPLQLDAPGQALLDQGVVLLGLTLTLVAAVSAAGGRERSDAAARARLYEVRQTRAAIARLREQTEADADRLERAVAQALRGRGIDPLTADGPLSPVAEGINAVAERLRTLQKDREDRLRLQAAVRALTYALERGWQGTPWAWPERSGTLVDELVDVLRTRRPPDSRGRPPAWWTEAVTPTSLPGFDTPVWFSWPAAPERDTGMR
jgi:hypothetical protein